MAYSNSFPISASSGSAARQPMAILHADQGPHLVVPGGMFLLHADFQRHGPDLMLVGGDGRQVLVEGYFAQAQPPHLATESGAVITPDLAARLAGPLAPGQYAANGAVGGHGEAIGIVDKLSGEVEVRHTDGSREALAKGAAVYQGDVLETGKGASVGLVLADRTTFSLGGNGRMVLDELVYDPAAKTGHSSLSVVQGAFSFVSGGIGKTAPDAMVVKTPVMTIGIRGTTVAGFAAAEGDRNVITLLPDADGGVGKIMVTNSAGQVLLSAANHSLFLSSFAQQLDEPVILNDEQLKQYFGDITDFRPVQPDHAPSMPDGGRGENSHSDGPRLDQFNDLNPRTAPDTPPKPDGAHDGAPTGPAGQSLGPARDLDLHDGRGDDGLYHRDEQDSHDFFDRGNFDPEARQSPPQTLPTHDRVELPGDEPPPTGGSATDSTLIGGAGDDYISGGGGNDVIDGGAGNDVLFGGAGNDVVNGGLGDDVLFGGDGSDTLTGGDGNDIVIGGAGSDLIIAGSGAGDDVYFGGDATELDSDADIHDKIKFSSSTTGVSVNLHDDIYVTYDGIWLDDHRAYGTDTGTDTIWGVEDVVASSANDIVIGNDRANHIETGAGNDILAGLDGADTLDGGAGDDIFEYALVDGETNYFYGDDTLIGGLGTDKIIVEEGTAIDDSMFANDSSIEVLALAGSWSGQSVILGADALAAGITEVDATDTTGGVAIDASGYGAPMTLTGGAGDDQFTVAGFAAIGTIDGGDGTDSLTFHTGGSLIAADLAHVTNIETLIFEDGSGPLSVTVGNGYSVIDAQSFDGGDVSLDAHAAANAVTLLGGSGNDTLQGGSGADSLAGGGGLDTVSYAGAAQGVIVDLTAGTGAHGGVTDSLSGFETVMGSAHDDSLTGDDGDNMLSGGAGNDILAGLDGADTLKGGDGDDVFAFAYVSSLETNYFYGDDSLIGGGGTDRIIVENGTTIHDWMFANDSGVEILTLTGSWSGQSVTLGADALAAGITEVDASATTGGVAIDASGYGAPMTLTGGAGDDQFTVAGFAAIGTIDGGDGTDSLTFHTGGSLIPADLSHVTNIETLIFEDGSGPLSVTVGNGYSVIDAQSFDGGDVSLDAHAAANAVTLLGSSGNDTLQGGSGADSLAGGGGLDTVSYAGAAQGVIVDLTAGTGAHGGVTDSLSGFENVTGSAHDDSLTGDDDHNMLSGGAGNDILHGGAGNDILDGGSGTDSLYGEDGDDHLTMSGSGLMDGGNGDDEYIVQIPSLPTSAVSVTIADGGGADSLKLGNGMAGQIDSFISTAYRDGLDLVFQMTNGSTVTLKDQYYYSEIENLDDGSGDLIHIAGTSIYNYEDNLIVAQAGNGVSIHGGAANDVLIWGGDDGMGDGTNWLTGNGGEDAAVFWNATGGISADLSTATVVAYGTNTYSVYLDSSVQKIWGSHNDDVFVGNSGNNSFKGAGGADDITGGDGTDTVIYSDRVAGVTVDLLGGHAYHYDSPSQITPTVDTLSGIENVEGSFYDDLLIAGNSGSVLTGLKGDDSLIGGAGSDMASYEDDWGGVTVDLAANSATDGWGDHDSLSGIENIFGSKHGDLLIGDDGDNLIHGGGGFDTLIGAAGNDTFVVEVEGGVSGLNSIDGGDGFDQLELHSIYGLTDTALAYVEGVEKINFYGEGEGTALIDLGLSSQHGLTDFDAGSTGRDLVVDAGARSQAITLTGGYGDDSLTGGSGNDSLNGGSGSDVIWGGAGNDTLSGGYGSDAFAFNRADASGFGAGGDRITDFDIWSDWIALGADFGIDPVTGVADGLTYFEQAGPLSSTAQHFGSSGSGAAIIVIGSGSGTGGVEVWYTEDRDAASTANSYQVARIDGINAGDIDAGNFSTPEHPHINLGS